MFTDIPPLLSVNKLSKVFPVKHHRLGYTIGQLHAVNQVSFSIQQGTTLGLIGESGCGKTTLGRTVVRLMEPTSGQIVFDGVDIAHYKSQQMSEMRKKMQIVFQDPYAALNPRMSMYDLLHEPIKIHQLASEKSALHQRIYQLLDYVQLPRNSLHKYPHEFSGGQRQRICIARALAVEPMFLVFDESTSALDVSVQAQIVNLLMDLQKELTLTYLFIAHDLKLVECIADNVAVMYLGKIVEMGPVAQVYKQPKHPYTKALLSAVPTLTLGQKKERIILQGDVPSPMHLPSGCHFHPRCWKANLLCTESYPETTEIGRQKHQFSCYHPENHG